MPVDGSSPGIAMCHIVVIFRSDESHAPFENSLKKIPKYFGEMRVSLLYLDLGLHANFVSLSASRARRQLGPTATGGLQMYP